MTHSNCGSCRPAYTTARSLILGVSTLAIVGVLFAVYQFSTGVSERPPVDRPTPPEPPPPPPPSTAEESPGVPLGQGAKLGPGGRITITQYEPGSKRARLELEISDWQPTGSSSDEFHVKEPELRLRTPDGQIVRLTADHGWVQLAKGTADSPEPTGGRFVGNVEIEIDRLTEAERQRLPEDERQRVDEDRLIHIAFDEITFDIDEARVETSGPFSLTMAEAELTSEGLLFRYNETQSRIELFEMLDGGSLTIRGAGAFFDASVPGASDAKVTAEVHVAATPTEEPPADQPVANLEDGETDDIPLFIPDEPAEPKVRPLQTYVADIEGDVSIRQLIDGELVLGLAAEKLSLLFDFTQVHRDAARTNPPAADTDGADGEAADPEAEAGADLDDRVFFKWTGPFVLRSVEPADTDDGQPMGRRLRIVATGEDVRFLDRRMDVVCGKIEVHKASERVWITGTADEPVVLNTQQCDEMVATKVFFDRTAGIARITGPARLTGGGGDADSGEGASNREASPGGVDLTFDRLAELTIGVHTTKQIDPATGTITENKSEYISAATFTGNVRMGQGAELIAGDVVEMAFDPPSTPGAFAENIRKIDAQGDVTMRRGDNRISADTLSILFGPDAEGRMWPRLADAVGDVTIRQGTRTITAGERITVVMVPVLKPKPPFDITAARVEAVRRGVDPSTVDWRRVRSEYEQKVSYTLGMETLDACGGVTAFDSAGGLDVTADRLACDFVDGRDIDRIRISGPAGQPAFVKLGELSVTAHQVDVDVAEQRLDVRGAGEMAFVTYRGLDGTESSTPQHVNVKWTDQMMFRGAINTGRFVGNVHAVTSREHRPSATLVSRLGFRRPPFTLETSTFDAQTLVIDFVDREPDRTPEPDFNEQWWVFAPLVERFAARTEPRMPSFSKDPVSVLALNDVRVVFTNTDPGGRIKNRVYLASAEMAVDLEAKIVTVPVDGTMLIEDYKMASLSDRSRGVVESPFASGAGNMPSQTRLRWSGRMSCDVGRNRAEFRDDVLLDYRSGAKMVLLDELATSYAIDPAVLGGHGRQTQLACSALIIEFGAAGTAGSSTNPSLGGISANDIRQFEASGGVYLVDDEFEVSADRIVKHAQSDLLTIYGYHGGDAEIEVYGKAGQGRRFQGPRFHYQLATGRIQVKDMIGRTRR